MKKIILLFLILTNPIILKISRNEMTKQFLHDYKIIKNKKNNIKTHRVLHKPSEVGKSILGSDPLMSITLIVAGMFIADHFLTDNRRERKLNKILFQKKKKGKKIRKLDKIVLTEKQAKILQESSRFLKGKSVLQKQIGEENKRFFEFVNRRGNWKKNLTPEKSLRIFKSYLELYKKKKSKKLFGEVKSLMSNMIGE